MKTLFYALLFSPLLLLADSDPSQPPNLYETQGGNKSAMFTAANAEASHWITLIDQAQYGPSWLDAGPIFQDLITQEQWIAAMRTLRRPLGSIRARKVGDHRFYPVLPGGTRGYFVTINFETEFSGKPGAVEKVVLMMIQNDQWRVISYSIR